MNAAAEKHISEDRITQVVAEGGGLRPDEQKHLGQCGDCRDRITALEDDLRRLQRAAVWRTPAPKRAFVLPAERPEGHSRRSWRVAWAAGTALSVALVALFLWVGRGERLPGLPPSAPSTATWEDPEMAEINMLAENALPEAYQILSESLDGGYDEEFVDFLIPPLEDDSVS
jgi:hypothetical protein